MKIERMRREKKVCPRATKAPFLLLYVLSSLSSTSFSTERDHANA